jgi:hypothetical protein
MEQDEPVAHSARSLRVSELAVPFIIFFLLYVLTLSNALSVATDSISYINDIDIYDVGVDLHNLFHPHHLLYTSLGWMWVALWRQLGVHSDSAVLMSVLNAIFGALTLCVFYAFLRVRLVCDRLTALLGTCLPAFSFAFWYYSGSIEVYIIPLFLLWLAFYMLTADDVPARTFLLAGFLNAIAVVIAQMCVLFATVVFAAAWYHRRNSPLTRSLANYLGAAVPTAGIPYFIVFCEVGRGHLHRSLYWLTLYTHQTRFWNTPSASTFLKVAVGLEQAFVGSHFLFALPRMRAFIERALPGHYLTHEAYLVRNLGIGTAYLLSVLSVCLFVIFTAALAVSAAHWSRLSSRNRMFIFFLTVWLVTDSVFVFFYTADNAKLWIVQVFCVWMLFLVVLIGTIGSAVSRLRGSKVVLASLVVLLFFVNFVGSIRFTHERANDYYYSRIESLLKVSHQGDLVIIGTSWKFEQYLRRYDRASILSLTSVYDAYGRGPESPQRVQSEIERTLSGGGRVVISPEALKPEKETIHLYPGIGVFATVWDKYRGYWCERDFSSGPVFVLEPGKREAGTGQEGTACSQAMARD